MLLASAAFAADNLELKTQKDKASYAIGLDMGGSLRKNEIAVNTDALVQGIKDGLTDAKSKLAQGNHCRAPEGHDGQAAGKAESRCRKEQERGRSVP
jgi:hypothetical protein